MSEISVIGLGSMGDCTRQSTAKRVSQSHRLKPNGHQDVASRWSRNTWCIKPGRGSGNHLREISLCSRSLVF